MAVRTFAGHVSLIFIVFVLCAFAPCASSLYIGDSQRPYERLFSHVSADFGPKYYDIRSVVRLASPQYLCTIDPLPPGNSTGKPRHVEMCRAGVATNFTSKIVLVERGPKNASCSFVTKVCNAQKLGAAGVIIGDYESNHSAWPPMPFMGAAFDPVARYIRIPSILISRWTYVEVETKMMKSKKDVWATLNSAGDLSPPSPPSWSPPSSDYYYSSSNRPAIDSITLAVFLCFVLACLLHIVWRLRKRCNRMTSVSAPQPQPAIGNGQPLVAAAPLAGVVLSNDQPRDRVALLSADSLALRV